MRSITTAALALATASVLTGSLLITGADAAGPGGAPHARTRVHHTDFALRASGFGTWIRGGQLPASSRDTAFQVIGCSTRAPVTRGNHELEAKLPGLGKVSGVWTRVWTRESHGVVSSFAENTIDRIVLARTGVGRVQIKAITAFAHSYHDRRGFHARTRTTIGSLQLVTPVGTREFDVPAPGRPVTIPGLGSIALGRSSKQVGRDGARALANSLVVTLASGTRVDVGRASAQTLRGAKHGTFRGYSAAVDARALDDNVTVGRTPLSRMPCQGTGGELRRKAVARLDLGDQIRLAGLTSQKIGTQLPRRSVAHERGAVARLDLGDGQLVVRDIVGRANVMRTKGRVVRTARGTRVGSVTANGEEQTFPRTGVLEIPGVARLERRIVERSRSGVSVIALRITLLDGTGGVVDLGTAKTAIRRN